MAVAALLLWLCTAAVGSYLLATSVRSRNDDSAPAEPVPVPGEERAAAGTAPAALPAAHDRDRFAPPSLRRAKSEPLPGMKALAEFAHPALAMIGFGFWLGYVASHRRLFAAIGLGILLGAILAGVSWATANARAVRRAAAGAGADSGGADSGTAPPGAEPLFVSRRVLAVHAIGAALTLLFAVLITARV